jgi:hypothetical protein
MIIDHLKFKHSESSCLSQACRTRYRFDCVTKALRAQVEEDRLSNISKDIMSPCDCPGNRGHVVTSDDLTKFFEPTSETVVMYHDKLLRLSLQVRPYELENIHVLVIEARVHIERLEIDLFIEC